MRTVPVMIVIGLVFSILTLQPVMSKTIPGKIGSSTEYGSGWIDLEQLTDFHKGDVLVLKLAGGATKVVVRLLADGASADSPKDMVGGILEVPKSKILEVKLEADYPTITQISVHGNAKPFGLFDLGVTNGPVILLSAELVSASGKPEAGPSYIRLKGTIGSAPQWGSGWLDLETVQNFKTGDSLKIGVGGEAKKILVRLLRQGDSPDSPTGIVGDPIIVPEDRVVTIPLDTDVSDVVQISVHGNANPWGLFPLGHGNGPALILYCDLKSSR